MSAEPVAEHEGPSSPAERIIADAWASVLRRDRVGLDDNFFTVGGDSIRAIQVRARVAAAGLKFSVRDFVRHPTVRGLARVAEHVAPGGEDERTAPRALLTDAERAGLAADVEDAYPLTQLQMGMLFHSALQRRGVFHDLTSVHFRARFDRAALERALATVASRHPILRTSFHLGAATRPLQLVHARAAFPLTVEDWRTTPADEQPARLESFWQVERHTPFDWKRPPLVRVAVHLRTDTTFQLTWTAHHAVLDGWSNASFSAELLGAYVLECGGDVAALEPLPALTFRDYVALELAALSSDEARTYWQRLLADAPDTVLDPLSEAGRGRSEQAPGRHQAYLPADISAALISLGARLEVPLKSVLLAAHLKVLSALAGVNDVVTGVVTHGRPEGADGARVLGLFLNAVPHRSRLTGGELGRV